VPRAVSKAVKGNSFAIASIATHFRNSSTDLPIRTTFVLHMRLRAEAHRASSVYPSYPDGNEKSRVLIVSYCWTQDADRMASFIKGDGKADKQLIDLVFSNLAQLHDVPEKYLRDMYEEGDYFAWSWNQDPNAMGASRAATSSWFC
jgi:hypothetical protein